MSLQFDDLRVSPSGALSNLVKPGNDIDKNQYRNSKLHTPTLSLKSPIGPLKNPNWY